MSDQPSPATIRLWGYILDDGTFRPSGEVRRIVEALEGVA